MTDIVVDIAPLAASRHQHPHPTGGVLDLYGSWQVSADPESLSWHTTIAFDASADVINAACLAAAVAAAEAAGYVIDGKRTLIGGVVDAGSTYGVVVSNNGTKISGSAELTVTKTSTGIYEVTHPFGTVVAVAAPAVAGRVLYLNASVGVVTVAVVDQLALEFADGGFHLLLTAVSA
jgi:hypothetical protein